MAAIGFGSVGIAAARRPGRWTAWQLAVRGAAVGYVIVVFAVTFLPFQIALGAYGNHAAWYSSIMPVPIVTADPPTFVLNIIMMVPFGTLAPLLRPGLDSIRTIATLSALISLGIEVLQLLLNVLLSSGRGMDVNDLLANTLGAVAGLLALRLALRLPVLGPLLSRSR
jgi:glycopeptide antibiotics resistance protein